MDDAAELIKCLLVASRNVAKELVPRSGVEILDGIKDCVDWLLSRPNFRKDGLKIPGLERGRAPVW